MSYDKIREDRRPAEFSKQFSVPSELRTFRLHSHPNQRDASIAVLLLLFLKEIPQAAQR